MKKAIKYVLIGLVALTVIGLIGQAFDKPKVKSSAAEAVSDSDTIRAITPVPTPEAPASQWEYAETVDKMDATKTKTATIQSTNNLEFEFPYGRSAFSLTVRKNAKGTDVYVYCSSCQFLTGIMGDKSYRVKFDDEAPFSVSVLGADSGDSKLAFLSSEKKLIEKIKKAKRMTVEAQFYEAGRQAIEFDVAGFQW